MAMINCGACGKPVEVDMSHPKILNFHTFSLIAVEHSGEVVCLSCRAVIIPSIQQIAGLAIVGMPVPPEQQSKKVLIPGGLPA